MFHQLRNKKNFKTIIAFTEIIYVLLQAFKKNIHLVTQSL
jgi:hypothetical protein